MITLLEAFHWSQLLQPQFYIEHGGLWLIMFVVFAETGLFAGFFLPGDSLLFVAGIYCAPLASEIYQSNNEWVNLLILFVFISSAGILGNFVGYAFGNKVGPTMYDWKENMFFKKKYLLSSFCFRDSLPYLQQHIKKWERLVNLLLIGKVISDYLHHILKHIAR